MTFRLGMPYVLGIATAFALCSGPAAATLLPLAQERSVQAEGWISDAGDDGVADSQSAAAPDFGPFSEDAQVALTIGWAEAYAEASQASTIGASLLVAEGSARAHGTLSYPHDSGTVGSESFFELSFQLDDASPWEIEASVAVDEGVGIFFAEIVLEGPGGTLLTLWAGDTFADVLLLDPGSYTVRARASAIPSLSDIDTNSGSGSFSLRFAEVPEPGTLFALSLGLAGLAGVRARAGRGSV